MSISKLALSIISRNKLASPIDTKENRSIRYTNNLKDYRKGLEFYSKLGLPKGTTWDDPGDKGAMFHLNDNDLIELIYSSKPGSPYINPFAMSKKVDDVYAAYQHLKDLGVNPAEITDREWGNTDTHIIDPLGNRINFWTKTKKQE
jgi:catechol 2,3-dioxygenase-like lactoylglutathione lyase family enzyme